MGLFGGGPSKHTKTVTYGQAETNALQPALFDSYMRLMGMGGTPMSWIHRLPMGQAIDRAYADAMERMSQKGYTGGALSNILSQMGRQKNVDVGNLWSGIGQGAGQARMQTTADMGNYLSNLTSQRPSYSMAPQQQSGLGAGGILQLASMFAGAMPPKQIVTNQQLMNLNRAMKLPSLGYSPMWSFG